MPQCQKLDGRVVDSKYFEKIDTYMRTWYLSFNLKE